MVKSPMVFENTIGSLKKKKKPGNERIGDDLNSDNCTIDEEFYKKKIERFCHRKTERTVEN